MTKLFSVQLPKTVILLFKPTVIFETDFPIPAMPSLPLLSMHIGLTSLTELSGSASLTWTIGTAKLAIQRRALPDFWVHVDREVSKISVSPIDGVFQHHKLTNHVRYSILMTERQSYRSKYYHAVPINAPRNGHATLEKVSHRVRIGSDGIQ
jgi:hypothetical protein